MTKPVTIPNTFATATTAIPLSNLDADFSTVATAMNDANTYSNYAPDTGSANAYVVTLSGVSTTYSAGLRIQFKAGNANTTASTLNVNGGGAKNITYQDATAIASGTIAANSIVDVMYDGTQFLLMNDPAGATGGDVVGPSSATDNAIVRFDGTTGKLVQNSVVTIADSTGDISGVGQLNATTLDATNIEVTNIKAKDGTAAASIADSTGVVSITANPVLSGGTANGVLYLNGSKVATSGSVVTYNGTTFGVDSAAVFNESGANVDFRVEGDTDANLLFVDASADAIGIGTGSPATRLHVYSGASGSATLEGYYSFAAQNYNLRLKNDGATYGYLSQNPATGGIVVADGMRYYGGGPWTPDGTSASSIQQLGGNIIFTSNTGLTGGVNFTPTEQMRLTSTGLGIGTSSPGEKLNVLGGGATTSTVNFTGGSTGNDNATIASDYSLVFQVDANNTIGGRCFNWRYGGKGYSDGTLLMTLDSSGNLGLGVTPSAWGSPFVAIQAGTYGQYFAGQTNAPDIKIGTNHYYNGTNYVYTLSSQPAVRLDLGQGGFSFNIAPSGTAGNTAIFTQALTLDANQNLLLNGTTAGASAVGTLAIFNGTAPTGSVTNGIILYAEDVSSSSELKVRDEAGNVTTLSPHNFSLIPEGPSEDMAWAYYSEKGDKRINVDMLKLARMVEKLTGEKLVYES